MTPSITLPRGMLALLAAITAAFVPQQIQAQEVVAVSAAWTAARGSTDELTYGLNAWNATRSDVAADPTYQLQIASLKIGLLRIHSNPMFDPSTSAWSWVDDTTRTWNEPRIRSIYAALRPRAVEIMQNIPDWPSWMDANADGRLDDGTGGTVDQRTAYANLCADLVRIANKGTPAYNIRYWEVFNENEMFYAWGDATLADIYNRCVTAMKAVDPTILVGGPALRNPYPTATEETNLKNWITAVKAKLDFFTYHQYGRTSGNATSDQAYDAGIKVGNRGSYIRGLLTGQGVATSVPIFLTETHLYASSSTDTTTKHMPSMMGANFIALMLKTAAEANVLRGVHVFADRDGRYGAMDNDTTFAYRGHGQLLRLVNTYLLGTVVATTTADTTKVQIMAVRGSNRRCVMIVNTSDVNDGTNFLPGTPYIARLTFTDGWTPSSTAVTEHIISPTAGIDDRADYTTAARTWSSTFDVTVPANTIKIVEFADAPAPVSLAPVADAYVRGGASAANNYGTATALEVKTSTASFTREAYLRFNLASLSNVSSARLVLYPSAAPTGESHKVEFVSTDSWGETTINWNNKPVATTLLATFTPVAGTDVVIDITSQVRTEFLGDKVITIRISSNTGGATDYASRENTNAGFRPELIVNP